MSHPANTLARFRSYNYYHVLAICDSSQTATDLSSDTRIASWQHPSGPEENGSDLGKYSVKTTSNCGKYCILINGSTDAVFTITKASWTSFAATSATQRDRNTSVALEGNIRISEPRGVIFLNQVVECCKELGIDSANAVWVLKTFFVGYVYEDHDDLDHITDVEPVIFLAYDVTGTFGVIGGEYEINFVAMANGAARMPQYSKAVTALNFKAGDTLSSTMTNLEANIKENYDRFFTCYSDQVPDSIKEKLRPISYKIILDPPYDTAAYKVTDQAIQMKDIANCNEPGHIAVAPNTSIEDAIHKIMGMCPKVKEDSSQGENGAKYTYKILNWVDSYRKDCSSDEIVFSVGYRVVRQIQPQSVSFTDVNPVNVITFDYLYTGKNIDILEFDIKMNLGMVYLQGATISNPYKQAKQQVSVTGTTVSNYDLRIKEGRNIPVFFGSKITTANIKDTNNIQDTAQHAYSMSKHASLEVIESSAKIMGNSQLLGSINRTTSPMFAINASAADDSAALFDKWSLTPAFAKINIKMPRNNDDASLFIGTGQTSSTDPGSRDYAVDFWFTGYYYIVSIEHVFEDGVFYQVLDMLGIPEKGSFTTDKSGANVGQDPNKLVQSCYDNKIPCSGSSSSSSSSGSTGAASQQPTTLMAPEPTPSADADHLKQEHSEQTTGGRDLSTIKGYNEASPEVKQAIHNAALNNGVDEFTLAQMCSFESNFKPNAQNKSSSAGGLFQFIDSTWNSYGGGNKYDPNRNADAGARLMKDNQNALAKSLGRQPTASELYLAHNQGVGSSRRNSGAVGILKGIDSGHGNDIANISAHTAQINGIPRTIRDANGNLRATNNDIANWAKNKMGSRLKTGIPVFDEPVKAPASLSNTTNALGTEQQQGIVSEAVSEEVKKNKEALGKTVDCKDVKTDQDQTASSGCPKVPSSVDDLPGPRVGKTIAGKLDNSKQSAFSNNSSVVMASQQEFPFTTQAAEQDLELGQLDALKSVLPNVGTIQKKADELQNKITDVLINTPPLI